MIFLRQEINVPWCDDADQFAAHLARLSYGDSRKSVSNFCFKYITYSVTRTQDHWISDETLFKPLQAHTQRPRHQILTGTNTLTEDLALNIYEGWRGLTFTLRASLAWNSGVQLWWMMPIPPISWNIHINYRQMFSQIKKKDLRGTHCHGNGHWGFSNSIHRRGDEWGLQCDFLGQCWGQVLHKIS